MPTRFRNQGKSSVVRALSLDAVRKANRVLKTDPIISTRNEAKGYGGRLSRQSTPKEEEFNLHLDFQEPSTLSLEDLKYMGRLMAERKTTNNIYDIKSQKELQCVLRNGYTYKFQEKKQYKGNQKEISAKHIIQKPQPVKTTTKKQEKLLLQQQEVKPVITPERKQKARNNKMMNQEGIAVEPEQTPQTPDLELLNALKRILSFS